jgi:hypothetical protein
MAKIYGNRWETVGTISAGGQGDVFRVTDQSRQLQGEWALKRLRRKDRVARFRRQQPAVCRYSIRYLREWRRVSS